MKILITGASGLVGRACQRIAFSENHSLSIVSSKSPINIETNYYARIEQIDKSEVFDLLIHSASATPNNSKFDEIKSINRIIDQDLCDLIKRASVKHVIYISSMAIYGNIDSSKIDETHLPNSPNKYGESKFYGETITANTCRERGTKCSVLRLPGVISQGMPSVFFKRAVANIACGDATTIRSNDSLFNNCVYVDDIYDTCISLYKNQNESSLVLNQHSKDIVRLYDLLNYIGKSLNKSPYIIESTMCNPSFLIENKSYDELLKTRTVYDAIDSFFSNYEIRASGSNL
ncbi:MULTISPECIES: NAD-dependent epimerase/dehydratase family protein [Prochlorococcus]|uniref:NAD dependent epimerase/dehydratase n=1 Tax=Prochlorococcus marinus (strain SARG / CCMP1375 / SS120) TaxID=167539 RepID=Q7VB18_PROMA|nr:MULTISPECIES: NAD(P)-dependent oxidoreductase [Prochlorococcus]AAQ00326.1 NAD dependent epimerase/dehydratase [Prochlorococcus marinus subsp. marinus str. CCMP1375]KGG10182.1 NAD dependent epimerase/dehydratase [Prochlorococcus marinus str. LG]KGG22224.1 NAD dependent epimerase/dehydratase [Prochlorococcus marinus str. SS2]KGG24459.1 NAD dependent epimerase/dehydratase [Prochlorococcus marinus str. SS35]KGG33354.1 NAD dependent epimerase/dehydratase [Prochlorococcus marinus str. SS51]